MDLYPSYWSRMTFCSRWMKYAARDLSVFVSDSHHATQPTYQHYCDDCKNLAVVWMNIFRTLSLCCTCNRQAQRSEPDMWKQQALFILKCSETPNDESVIWMNWLCVCVRSMKVYQSIKNTCVISRSVSKVRSFLILYFISVYIVHMSSLALRSSTVTSPSPDMVHLCLLIQLSRLLSLRVPLLSGPSSISAVCLA